MTQQRGIRSHVVRSTDHRQAIPRYDWWVYTFQLNPKFDPDLKREQGDAYTVDQKKFVKNNNYDVSDSTRFTASADNPTLIVKSSVLNPSTTYKFRLLINVGQVTGYADITMETAGLPPRQGTTSPCNLRWNRAKEYS